MTIFVPVSVEDRLPEGTHADLIVLINGEPRVVVFQQGMFMGSAFWGQPTHWLEKVTIADEGAIKHIEGCQWNRFRNKRQISIWDIDRSTLSTS